MKQIPFIIALTLSLMTHAQTLTDWHCHNITADYLAALERHDALMDELFPIPRWSAEEHLAFMDSAGIATAVLTMPAPQPYWGDGAESQRICRAYNEETAALCRQHEGRFLFAAALPLPDVERAISEAEYALTELGAVGVKLPTNSRGLYLGDPALEPLMQRLNELEATVIIHPHKPVPVSTTLVAATPMALHEYLAETTRAVVNMLSHNVPARYPRIRFVVPHCGAFLPLEIPRYSSLLPLAEKMQLLPAQGIDIEKNLSNFYFDLAGAPEPSTLRSLLTITTPDHLLYGSDYPYVAPTVLLANLRRLRASQPDAEDMLVRLAEIEVHPQYLAEYLEAACTIAATSVAQEPGVIALFPMQLKEDSCQFRILEIYASPAAYQSHLQTAHFQAYKQGTLHMVKRLTLLDTRPLDISTMPLLFNKLNK